MSLISLPELMKISSCADERSWKLLVAHGPALIKSCFGRIDGCDPELKKVADEIAYRAIKVMLDVSLSQLLLSLQLLIRKLTSSRRPTSTRSASTVSSRSVTAFPRRWSSPPSSLSDMVKRLQ